MRNNVECSTEEIPGPIALCNSQDALGFIPALNWPLPYVVSLTANGSSKTTLILTPRQHLLRKTFPFNSAGMWPPSRRFIWVDNPPWLSGNSVPFDQPYYPRKVGLILATQA